MERDLRAIKEEVRSRTDIVQVISGYTQLKRSGKNWSGLCPFHADKNPSFRVSPETQSYRCWSCGEKGDVFTFVMKKESLEFVEALEKLARQAGVPFERRGTNPQLASEREQMRELNRMALQFFQERLAVSSEAKEYLAKRAVLKATQEQFEIGFAANEWEGLTFYLQRRRANLELAATMGLIKAREKERGGYYDFFRNRIMIPIHDLQGDVIGFGGRAISPEDRAKYMNSEASPLFDKSKTLYGLFFAKKGKLSEERPPVIVEGYMDVITAHQAGFTQCVAILGTAFTEEHAKILTRYSKRIVISTDADNAGRASAMKTALTFESAGITGAEAMIARMPEGEDPDSLLKRGDTAAFQTALDNSISRTDFQIETTLARHNLQTDMGKENALAEVIPILATIRSLTQRDRKAQQLAYLHPASQYSLGRAIESILADVKAYAEQDGGSSPRDRGYPRTTEANAGSLQEQPPPPHYRPPSSERWGQFDPGTRNTIRKGDGNGQGRPGERQNGYGRGDYGGKSNGYGGKGKDRYGRNAPQGDPTPPSLVPPILSGAQKAERTLLRALLAPETRANLLAQLDPNLLVTPQARGLYSYIARTPANADGGIDVLPLLYQIEREEEEADAQEDFGEKKGNTAHESEPDRQETASRGRSIKISEYLRDLLEDSRSVVSNEPVNEAVAADCIRRLEKYRADQAQRELKELLLRPDLTDEQKTAVYEQYHQRMREMRGTPRTDRDAPDGGSL